MKTLTTILLSVLLSGVGHSDDTASKDADWASLNINLAALKSWGTKRYTYSRCNPDGKVLKVHGTVSLFTELADDKVILKDKCHLQLKPVGEGMASLELIQTCRKDNFLSPARIESKGEGYDDFTTFVATVAKGKATVRSEGEKQTVRDVPDGAITDSALWRLVTLVDRTPGKTYTYKYSLESAEMNLKEDFRLEVLPAAGGGVNVG